MKEVVIIGPKQFEVREVPVPKPADNEVLIQMKAAGVCGSDVHQFLGENPNAVFPRVPGHENAGVIVEVGKDVKNVKVGDHVKKGQTVCLMEAMKMMNEVQAPCDCVIEEILQEDGALVSFGEPLLRYREG